MGRPPMGWAPAVFGRFLKPGGLGGRPKLALALPTMPLVRENYATTLNCLKRYKEAEALLRKTLRVARRVIGTSHQITLRLRWIYAQSFHENPGATLDDLREAVTTLEDTERIARRVLGGSNPTTLEIERDLQLARARLRAREASTGSA